MAKRLDKILDEVNASGDHFSAYLQKNLSSEVLLFLQKLRGATNILIFSGVIRNFFLGIDEIRDLDIVINDDLELDNVFNNYNVRKNSFGGYKFTVDNITVDVWAIEKTWAIQYQKNLTFQDLEKYIPSTAFFNFSAIVYSFKEKKFYCSSEFLSFIRDKEINYVYKPNSNYALCVVNTLYYVNEYNLKVADKLVNFLKVLYKKKLNYYDAQVKHFGKVLYTDEQIKSWIDNLNVRKRKVKT